MMDWYNLFFNLNFVNGSYVEFIKILSFYVAVGTMIIIFLALLCAANKHNTIGNIFRTLLIIALYMDIIAIGILLLLIFIYPVMIACAYTKDFIITYRYKVVPTTIIYHLVVNTTIAFAYTYLYLYFFKKIFEKI